MRSERVQEVNGKAEAPGGYVLYWMQGAVRGRGNLALDWAAAAADERKLPLLAVFCLVDDFPSASPAHYRHLLEGLRETAADLADKGVRLAVARGAPGRIVGAFAAGAALVVADCGPLRIQRTWLADATREVPCRLVRIEADAVVPIAAASPKEEWSAYTLRRRIMPLIDLFLDESDERAPRLSSIGLSLPASCEDLLADIDRVASAPPGAAPARAPEQRIRERAGYRAARSAFDDFLARRLDRYDEDRNDPTVADGGSLMSAALHFGHISPVELASSVVRAVGGASAASCAHRSAAAYIEELVVRRELARNFVFYRDDYDRISAIPEWAGKTLAEGALHRREAVYSFAEFEAARTHDPYWNAAQDQMVLTGRMHGYMRMYWGKQILAWSPDPASAYRTAVALNDAYSLDGRDPNGYAGVAWCFGKHDRPWTGRPVFGTVRYMNANGLKRKFDADAYVRTVRALKETPCSTI